MVVVVVVGPKLLVLLVVSDVSGTAEASGRSRRSAVGRRRRCMMWVMRKE